MTVAHGMGMLVALMLLLVGWDDAAAASTAQEEANGGLWSMGIGARTEGAEYPGHTFGARFTVTTEDGDYIGECTLEEIETSVPWYNCRVDVPSDRVSLVWEDLDSIPAGYAPVENPIVFNPATYETGPHNIGAVFLNAPIDGSADTNTSGTSDVAIVPAENGQPVYDACFVIVDYSQIGCDENRDGKITFEDIPYGTWTVRQTADLGPGRAVADFTIRVTGAASGDGWERFPATVGSSGSSSSGSLDTSGSDASLSSGSVDIALITRDPDTGGLLTDTCYVLLGYSNEGCDENGDGQVTFADIPYGSYTVHQTRTPAGYPTINDYEIRVEPIQAVESVEMVGYPLSFVVKQAPEQNAPNTRNVSVVLIDARTGERVQDDFCLEIVGVSIEGCDTDLPDGQIDFLDVPTGGPYEINFTRIPPGYNVNLTFDGGPWLVIVNDGPEYPANRMAFVFVSSPDASDSAITPGSGSTTGTGNLTVYFWSPRDNTPHNSGGCVELVGASGTLCNDDYPDGRIEISDIPAGTYEVCVSHATPHFFWARSHGPTSVTITPGSHETIQLDVYLDWEIGEGRRCGFDQ